LDIPSVNPRSRCGLSLAPVVPYFAKFLQDAAIRSGGHIFDVIKEVEIEIIKSSRIKNWIEEFYSFSQKLGGETAELMGEVYLLVLIPTP